MKNFKSFRLFCEGLSTEDIEFAKTLPDADDDHYTTPKDMLYRWVPPTGLDDYVENDTMEPVIPHSKDKLMDPGIDQYGEKVGSVGGIPFWESTHKFFGYAEPFLRIVLDKKKIIDDGYTLFDPKRDPGEVRIAEAIKNWRQYLIVIEINRDEIAPSWDDEFDDYYSEFPIPLFARKKIYTQLKQFPNVMWLTNEWFNDNLAYLA